jgi:hypothetical protein
MIRRLRCPRSLRNLMNASALVLERHRVGVDSFVYFGLGA